MKQFSRINRVLGVAALESAKGTVDLNLEQLEDLNNALANSPMIKLKTETAEENNRTAALRAEIAGLKSEIAAIEQRNSAMSEALDQLGPVISGQPTLAEKVKAVRALLSARPGAVIPSHEAEDENTAKKGETDWPTINALPHNREADRILTSKN